MAGKYSVFHLDDSTKNIDLSCLTESKSPTIKNIIPAICEVFKSFQFNLNNIVENMQKDFVSVVEQQDAKINELRAEITVMKKQISSLEEKIDDNEAYERRDSLVLSGNAIPPCNNNEDCMEVVKEVVSKHLRYIIQPTDISVVHRLGKKPISQKPDRRNIIIKFCRRNTKMDLLAAARKMKPQDVFLNESLTPQRQNISYALRKAKREFPSIISGTSTIDGRVFVWVKPPNPELPGARDSRMSINCYSSLENFCKNFLRKSMNHFIIRKDL